MTTILRKMFVLGVVAAVLGLASIDAIVHFLNQHAIPERAGAFRDRFLTGTAIAIIVALLVLLRSERPRRRWDDHSSHPRDYR